MKVTGIIMLLITMIVAKHHHYGLRKSIYELKGNFFGQVREDVHVAMEKIFQCVNLKANFTKEPNIKLLLTMYRDLSNIADKNYDTFNDIQNTTTINIDNHTQAMINLDKIVTEILNANNFNVYEKIKGRKRSRKHAKLSHSKKANISSEFSNSQELMNFVIDFVDRVNSKQPANVSKYVSFRRNLKVWKPPSNMIIDSFNGTQSRRVYRGVKTKVKKFPFIVSVHIMGEFTCAGAIIGKDIIITAASCLQVAYKNEFFEHNPKAIYVRLGSDYTMRDGETIPVHKLYFHPLFDSESLNHNLVLVQLERRILFTREQKTIRRVLWDKTPGKLTDETDSLLIVGWGVMKSDKSSMKRQRLTVDFLDVYDLNECRNIYSEEFVSDECFCAGFVKRKGGECNGDVGGPGIVGEVLVGVVSFGAPVCGSGDTPTVFTKLGYYAAWIESIMGTQEKTKSQKKLKSIYTSGRRKHSALYTYRVVTQNNSRIESEEFRLQGEYPQEVKVLRDILNDLILPNTTLVDDLLYGELYDDFKELFVSEEVIEDMYHPLVNKSIVMLPNIHFDTNKNYMTEVLTTSTTVKPYLPVAYPKPSTSSVKQQKLKLKHENDLRIEKNHPKSDETEYETEYETQYETDYDTVETFDTDNYESTDEISKGLSIEFVQQTEITKASTEEKYEIKTGHIIEHEDTSNDEKRPKKNRFKLKHNFNKKGRSHKKKRHSDEISDSSDKTKRNSKKLSQSSEKKPASFGEKETSSDESSQSLRKSSAEKMIESQQINEKLNQLKEEHSEETSINPVKKKKYNKGIRSDSDEESQEFSIRFKSKEKSSSRETKEKSHKTNSNSDEVTTKTIGIPRTIMDLETISIHWGLIGQNMRNRPVLIEDVHDKGRGMTAPIFFARDDIYTPNLRSEQKGLKIITALFAQENRKTTDKRTEKQDSTKAVLLHDHKTQLKRTQQEHTATTKKFSHVQGDRNAAPRTREDTETPIQVIEKYIEMNFDIRKNKP